MKTDISYARSRSARKLAGKRLKSAAEFLKQGNSTSFIAELHHALSRFIADKLNISAAGITEEFLAQEFSRNNYPDNITTRVNTIFEQCNRARFSPADLTPDTMDILFKETDNIIMEIENHRVQ